MAKTEKDKKRTVDIDGTSFGYMYREQPNNFRVMAPGLNEFQTLTLEKADDVITRAIRIKRRHAGHG